VHNTISNYMPHLGMDDEKLANHLIPPSFTPAPAPATGTASALVIYRDQQTPVPLELAVALQVAAMAQYARAQVASQAGQESPGTELKLALTVPTHFNARQTAALQDARHTFSSPTSLAHDICCLGI
jgi:molecular chaperone DnaK (HSP70)